MARRIDPAGLVGHAKGEIELDGNVLVLKHIQVTYSGFELTDDDRDTIQRVVATHPQGCPVARSLQGAIVITTAVEGL
ncbi:MAG: hypothetical protein ACRD2C_11985 [Acidimicrobiales bacterium]